MKRRLASRLMVIAIPVLIAGGVLASMHTIYTEQRLLGDQAVLLGQSMARAVGAMSVDALIGRDYAPLESKVEALVRDGQGVVMARIERGDGHAVAEYPRQAATVPAHHVIVHDIEVGDGSGRHRIGRVVLGVHRERAAALLADRSWQLAALNTLIVIALCAVLALLVRRVIGAPLARLDAWAARIGEGELDATIELATGDELERLAGTLDDMRKKLKARDDERHALTASLRERNAHLVDALARSEEATRIKSEFLANVSHELRTPLNTIVNVPEVLLTDFATTVTCSACPSVFALGEDERVEEHTSCPDCGGRGTLSPGGACFVGDPTVTERYLRAVHRAGVRLASVVEDLLAFSQLMSGRVDLRLERVPIVRVLEDVRARTAAVCARAGIELRVTAPEDAVVRADADKLLRILRTLVDNAVKFSPGGGVIELGATLDGDACILAVRDHGIGIPRDMHDLIFESFRQADGGQTRRYGGTGLGLAIVKKLVDLHEGTITVDSEEGQGSTFRVRLRVDGPTRAPEQAEADPQRPVAVPAPIEGEPSGKTIVVVDDHEDAIEATRLALRHLPYRVLGVADAQKALEAIRRLSPDLIILDLLMPRVSGISILRDLRADEATKDLPVLVTSAYTSKKDAAVALGARWLNKPWSNEAVAVEVVDIIEQRRRARVRAGKEAP